MVWIVCPPILVAYLILFMSGPRFKLFAESMSNKAMLILFAGFLMLVGMLAHVHFNLENSMTLAEKLRKLAESFAALFSIFGTGLIALGVVIPQKQRKEIARKINAKEFDISDVMELLYSASKLCVNGLCFVFLGWVVTLLLAAFPSKTEKISEPECSPPARAQIPSATDKRSIEFSPIRKIRCEISG